MSGTEPSETKPRKMVSRNVAVALGIVCIVLVIASSIGAYVYYAPIINDKDITISSLISQSNANYTNLQSLQNQFNDLSSIVNLNNSRTWVSNQTIVIPLDAFAGFTRTDTDYPGYVLFTFQSPMNDTTQVEAIYTSNNVQYDYRENVSTIGATCLPVLPTSNLLIKITDPVNPVSVTFSAIYVY